MRADYRPRKSIDLTEKQFKKLQEYIPWGLSNELFRCIVEDLIELCEKHGPMVVAALVSRRVSAANVLKTLKEINSEDKKV